MVCGQLCGSRIALICDILEEIMKSENISQWAYKITQDIYSEIYSDKEKYNNWEDGIKVFYSKVTQKPPLMIISYQPGGDIDDYIKEDKDNYENGNFEPPSKNAYKKAEQDKMSKRVKDLFGRPDLDYLLDASVALPLIFFRASSIKVFRRNMGEKILGAENYCFSKVKEIIEKLQPDRILVFGIGTFDQMLQCGIFKDVQVKRTFFFK